MYPSESMTPAAYARLVGLTDVCVILRSYKERRYGGGCHHHPVQRAWSAVGRQQRRSGRDLASVVPYFGLRSYQDDGQHYEGQIGDEATPNEFVDALVAATKEMMRVVKPEGSIWVNLGDRFSPGMALSRAGMTMTDAAWLAGVIDSDGSISIHVNKQPEGRAPSFVPWMRVGQMRPEVVEQIAAVTGLGRVGQDGRGVWNWAASAQQAAGVLRLIWPWLHIKQRQALAAVELARHIGEARNKGVWNKVSQEDIDYRQRIREAVLDWNAGRPNDYEPPRLPRTSLPPTRAFIESKSLIGIPWRYAIRCIDDLGLILRAEVIWSKKNGLPESVTDRVRRSHEVWFHFTQQPRYFSNLDEIREPHAEVSLKRTMPHRANAGLAHEGTHTIKLEQACHPAGRLPGSVWEVATQPFQAPEELGVDHYAAFPMEFPRRIIAGWCPADGVVLDPFGGTGTTALVAKAMGRHGISVDLSGDYCRLAQWRTTDAGQLARAAGIEWARKPRKDSGPGWDQAMFDLGDI